MYLARRGRRKLDGGAAQFYEDFFSDLDTEVLSEAADRRKVVRLEGVRAAVRARARAGGRLLDVGCGCGDNLASLAALPGLELHGIEYAESNVARARKLLGARATVVQASALALPFPAAHFQTVTCIEVLEHLQDDAGALREMHRVLEPGGALVLTVPYRHWFPAYRTWIGHERHYDRATLGALVARHGFAIEEHIPNYPRWHRAADYAYVLCRVGGVVAGRLGGERAPHRVRVPGTGRPLLGILNGVLEPLYAADAKLDYTSLEVATSIVARRLA
jgi:SAM-dependent methyltransferase